MKNVITTGYPKEMIVINGIGEKERVFVLCEYRKSEYPYKTINQNGVLNGFKEVFELPKIKRVPLEPSIDMLDWEIINYSPRGALYKSDVISVRKDGLVLYANAFYSFLELQEDESFKYRKKETEKYLPCRKEIEE